MYIEKNGINTLGLLRPKEINGIEMLNNIWKINWEGIIDESIHEQIIENTYDNNYKYVDDILKPLIGIYPLNIIEQRWVKTFINKVKEAITVEYLIYEKNYNLTNENMTKGEFVAIRSDIFRAVDEADYIKGTTLDSYKRETKLLKYIKQQIKKIVRMTDQQFDSEEFIKYYVKYKESSKPLHLVITNSISSFLGMSSYAPKKSGSDNNRLWTSCQSALYSESGYLRSLPSNFLDSGSLIAYVTDRVGINFLKYGEKVLRANDNIDNETMHQQMYARYIVRALKSNEDERPIIAFDRAYHSSMYTETILNTIAPIIKNIGYTLALHYSRNIAQMENVFDDRQYTKHKSAIDANSAFPIQASIKHNNSSYEYDKCETCAHTINRNCDNCDNDNDCDDCEFYGITRCGECINFDGVECANRFCHECASNSFKCRYKINLQDAFTHYDDQNSVTNMDNSKIIIDDIDRYTYKIKYKVFINMEDEFIKEDKEKLPEVV
ncbi:MAG: hypothetical protein PHY47_12815 [Lachnospiraceae bacterium]|nr:hypothetical protein [Lachnospiraceae bacterium]